MIELEVHIDESGLFTETSTDPQEQQQSRNGSRKFASQLAGVVVVYGDLKEEDAENIIRRSCKNSEVEFKEEFHATELKGRDKYSRLVNEFCIQLQKYKIQPFRIVNAEQITFGNRTDNYTNVLAELLIRICHEYSKYGHDSIAVNVHSARVVLEKDELGIPTAFIEDSDYRDRIKEYLTRAAVRRGYGRQTKNWHLKSFRLGSGRTHKILQLADIISNASHDNFMKCDKSATASLKAALGTFDFTLSSDTFYDEVNEFVLMDSFGLAFILMARRSVDFNDVESDELLNVKLAELGKRYNQLSASVKLPQLRILMSWLQQSIETRTDLNFSLAAAKWIRTSLVKAIGRHAKSEELLGIWLEFTTTSLMITTLNHLGRTVDAENESNRLNALVPQLAGRWEYSTEIFEALIAQAVHKNDCFDHQGAKASMTSVVSFFQNLTGFFADAFPDLFPEQVQSDLWAKALGTMVQSETFLLLQNKGSLEQVRQTSDAAIEQFVLLSHKQRQYQFRSEIEAIGGNWGLAREFLAKSLDCEGCSHEEIASTIAELELKMQGFPLLHWTRLGGMAASSGSRRELADFNAAFKANRFKSNQWIIGTASNDYPAHGILRRMAVVRAFNGDISGAKELVSRLRNIILNADSWKPVFDVILLSTLVQLADILHQPNAKEGLEYLDEKDAKKLGAKQVVGKLVNRIEPSHPIMAKHFSAWLPIIDSVLIGEQQPSCLAKLWRQIGY